MKFFIGTLLLPCVSTLRLFSKYNSDNTVSKKIPRQIHGPVKPRHVPIMLNDYEYDTNQNIGLLKIVVVLGYIECYSLSHFLKIVRPDLNIPSF
jgi:hypothetical protein